MRYFLLMIVLLVFSSLIYKYWLAEPDPGAYTNTLKDQNNFFCSSKDSAAIVWQRAKEYLNKNARLINGGTLQENDTLLYLPYYNDHKKGNSIRIEKHVTADSISFLVQWWYSQQLQVNGSKEIALFMEHNLEKSDFK